jgi:hypothetical protein
LDAVRTRHPVWQVGFARFVELLTLLTGRAEQFESVLNAEEDA